MAHFVLMDIEGTTTSISFVHDVLFPYSRKHLRHYVAANRGLPAVENALSDTINTLKQEGVFDVARTTTERDAVALAALEKWIDEDRKHPALKTLQGMLWEAGYRSGEYKSHVYDDVIPNLRKWHKAGLTLAIYSSGSVPAQKLLFAHTEHGDVTPMLSAYFDTSSGSKREASSYANIVKDLGASPGDVLFLSDVPEELDAAKAAGLKTTQLVRPGTTPSNRHPTVSSFDGIAMG